MLFNIIKKCLCIRFAYPYSNWRKYSTIVIKFMHVIGHYYGIPLMINAMNRITGTVKRISLDFVAWGKSFTKFVNDIALF